MSDALSFSENPKEGYILINLGTHNTSQPYLTPSRKEILSACEFLSSQGFEVKWLPFHQIDKELALFFNESMSYEFEILPQPKNFSELSAIFKNAQFAIGERLHFVVSSCLFKCPFFSSNYAEKHSDFLRSIDLESFGKSENEIKKDSILHAFNERDKTSLYPSFKRLLMLKQMHEDEKISFLKEISPGTYATPTSDYISHK